MPRTKADRRQPTFIQNARRAQLVECAIEVIAELGVERASMVRIADRAGVSRGVVAYHFASRDDLLNAVVSQVYSLGEANLSAAVRAAESPREALSLFVSGSVDFYAAYPRHMRALSSIFAAGHGAPARDERGEHGAEMLELESILDAGQQRGQFRTFDSRIMAGVVRAALDAALRQTERGDDARVVADELRRTFDAATRSEHS